jgi:hypothetical protein
MHSYKIELRWVSLNVRWCAGMVGFDTSNKLPRGFQSSKSFYGDGTHDSRVPRKLEEFSLLSETNQNTSTP